MYVYIIMYSLANIRRKLHSSGQTGPCRWLGNVQLASAYPTCIISIKIQDIIVWVFFCFCFFVNYNHIKIETYIIFLSRISRHIGRVKTEWQLNTLKSLISDNIVLFTPLFVNSGVVSVTLLTTQHVLLFCRYLESHPKVPPQAPPVLLGR